MKHIFVINPKAGKTDRVEEIKKELKAFDGKIDYEVYVTKKRGDAKDFVHEYLTNNDKKETYRFYACGGDGTLHDVVNGAVGFENAQVACYASGSGNDFVKNFGNTDKFKDLKTLIDGKPHKIDLLKVDDRYCINIFNYVFDGEVTFAMLRFKKWPCVSGPMAYNLAALTSLLFKMNQYLKVKVDDKVIFDGKGLLVAVANGHTYGGGFHCAPEAKVDDGLIDVCLVKKVSRFKAANLIKVYKAGEHLQNEKLKNTVVYLKGKDVVVESHKPVAFAIDGEVFRKEKVIIKMIPSCLNFVVPQE
ncbi:MAG: diacylglycerol kinase family protein [Bacilli bacterium]